MRKLKNEELDRLDPEAYKLADKRSVVMVLDDIRSLHNVGAAFRTGEAFRIEKIFLCGITGQPPHRDIHKSALGATETVDWAYARETVPLVRTLQNDGYQVVVIEQADQSEMLTDAVFEKDQAVAFVFGNEVFGVKEEVVQLADRVLEIPQFGTKHSLNVSVSMGVVLWDQWVKTR